MRENILTGVNLALNPVLCVTRDARCVFIFISYMAFFMKFWK